MDCDRIIAGTSTALSLLIGAWLALNWISDQPAPVKAHQAMPNLKRPAEAPKVVENQPAHAQVVVLPPPPPPAVPAALAAAKPAPESALNSLPQTIESMPAPQKAAPKTEPLKPTAKPVPKPVLKLALKPFQPVTKSKLVEPIQPIQTGKPKQPGEQEPSATEKFDALAHFNAMRTARKQVEAKTKPAPLAPAPSQPAWIEASAKAEIIGHVALRFLEHGEGPEIEIAWPHSASASNQLYRLFISCYGMRTAVMDSAGRLYTASGGVRPWPIDLDRYSGFVRHVSGRLVPEEESELHALQIVRRSRVIYVRVFPRSIDASLLGGLGQLLGKAYRTMSHIRATYRMTGTGVVVGGISADGRSVTGEIVLRPLTRRCAA